VRLVASDHGGHVGFVGRKGVDPDARWLDWRVVEIVTGSGEGAGEEGVEGEAAGG